MKKFLFLGMVVLLASGAAHAIDYTYVGGGTVVINGSDYETQFNDTANWNPSLTLPTTTTDNFHISTYLPGPTYMNLDNEVYLPNPGAGNTLYFGSVVVDNGMIYIPAGARGTYEFSGNFEKNTVSGGADARFASGSNIDVVFDVGGDFLLDSYSNKALHTTTKYMTILMRGSSATYAVFQYAENAHDTKLVIVDNGASVNFRGTHRYHNSIKDLDVWGTATGDMHHGLRPTEWAPDLGGDTTGLNVKVQPYGGSSRGMLMQGHFQDVHFIGSSWNTTDGDHVAALPGNLRVRNLNVGTYKGGPGTQGYMSFMVDTDNLNIGTSNLTVDEDLRLGPSSSGRNYIGILKANSSTIDVGGDVLVQYGVIGGVGSHILGGSAAFFVGGDWLVSDPTKSSPSWDMGTSTVTFDGSDQTVDAGNGVPFYNVVVNQTASTFTLDDNLVILGNLTFDSASTVVITNESDAFILAGGIDCETTAQEIDVDDLDLISMSIIGGSDSYVKLMSDLTLSDNLNIASGCRLYLNTFTLYAEGETLVSAEIGEMAWDDGTIMGTIPEPGTILLIGTGLLGLLGYIRRRRMN